ncbi:MAG: flavodoxin family protein [Clostridia bacterium]|jgi:multimeric flavodoxin WrbA|nr:flavodoxin family protein [Clostridia bacterium]
MKKIVVINASPRVNMNTGILVREAAKGAESEGAEVQIYDLYRLDKVHGCMSCFACKLKPNEGKCVYRDGLEPVLEAIRNADGLVIGTPNYLGDVSAGFHALYERLIFQSLTYQKEPRRYDIRRIPVLFVMTSNCPEELYPVLGYRKMLKTYQKALDEAVGNTKVFIAGNTLQVKDYSRFNWTMFDAAAKQERHEKVFPEEQKKAFELGAQMIRKPW